MQNKILIIDDDYDFVDAMSRLLRASGYGVDRAANGLEGFKKVKEGSPDLILLDMVMTYKTEGAETAKSLAADAAARNIPVILITGIRKEQGLPVDLKVDKDKLPVKAVLEKPVNPEALLKLVKTFITRTGLKHREIIDELSGVVDQWVGKRGNLVMVLHAIQNRYGYVPREISFELARLLDVPLARIYEVITFYNYFKLEPPGRHVISVCMGTACYLKGTPQILAELKGRLGVEEGQTTDDNLFSLQVVRCLGCCGLAPVMMIDDKVYGKVKKEDVKGILAGYSKEAAVEQEV